MSVTGLLNLFALPYFVTHFVLISQKCNLLHLLPTDIYVTALTSSILFLPFTFQNEKMWLHEEQAKSEENMKSVSAQIQ